MSELLLPIFCALGGLITALVPTCFIAYQKRREELNKTDHLLIGVSTTIKNRDIATMLTKSGLGKICKQCDARKFKIDGHKIYLIRNVNFDQVDWILADESKMIELDEVPKLVDCFLNNKEYNIRRRSK